MRTNDSDVRRDDDPFSSSNDNVTREETLEFEMEFIEWKSKISPLFKAKMMACWLALFGDKDLAEAFYEAALFEAFCELHEKGASQAPVDSRDS